MVGKTASALAQITAVILDCTNSRRTFHQYTPEGSKISSPKESVRGIHFIQSQPLSTGLFNSLYDK